MSYSKGNSQTASWALMRNMEAFGQGAHIYYWKHVVWRKVVDSQKRSVLIKVKNYRTCLFIQSYRIQSVEYWMGLHFFLLPSGNFGVLVPCFISTTLSSPFIEAKQKNLDSTSRSYITQISFFAILYRLVFPHECISFEI